MELRFLDFCNEGALCWFWWAGTRSQVLNGIAQVLFWRYSSFVCELQFNAAYIATGHTASARIMDYQAAGNAAHYKTNSLSKGRSRNAIYFKTVCHGGVFVSTVRRAEPPTAGNLAVTCTTRKFAISRFSDT